MAAETQYTANTGLVTISTANTNLDGTGTLGTVLTAGSSGTLIKTVTIKAQTTTTQGMVRLFVYDGTNTRLIKEIEIPPMTVNTTTGTDCSFERTIELNYKLKATYILKASTQIGESFNIIAEGLDWTYYTTQVRPESTQYVANTGISLISTANTNLDGTGTIGTVLTAGASATYKGCAIDSITIKAAGTVTHGMVRIFIYNGTTSFLLTEVFVNPIAQVGTFQTFSHTIRFPNKLQIAAGYIIKASTQNAENFSVTAEGADWKYPSDTFVKNYTATSGTAVTTEELLHSLSVPANLMASGGLMQVYANIATNNNANNKTFRIYVNTSASLSGATLLGTYITNNLTGDNINRLFPIISDTSLECFGGTTTSTESSYGTTTGTSAAITVPSVSAGFFVIISGQKAVGGDTDTVRWSVVRRLF